MRTTRSLSCIVLLSYSGKSSARVSLKVSLFFGFSVGGWKGIVASFEELDLEALVVFFFSSFVGVD